MKVLIHSRVFLPSFGGLEKMMDVVASQLITLGHSVTVITETWTDEKVDRPYKIVRSPGILELFNHSREADVCLVANISLRATPILLLSRRPVVTSHQGWYDPYTQGTARAFLKRSLARLTNNIFCSSRVGQMIPSQGIVIPNTFESDFFHNRHEVARDRDIVFVGRLVSDKGCDILLDALADLRVRNLIPTLTIIGSGEQEEHLKAQASRLDLGNQVKFEGKLEGEELARCVSRHRIMAVPSKWEEPFGIVALEGAACGCVIVGTEGGGLPEAIGPCGITVRRGDAQALSRGLQRVLEDTTLVQDCRNSAEAHLNGRSKSVIGRHYASALEAVISGKALR